MRGIKCNSMILVFLVILVLSAFVASDVSSHNDPRDVAEHMPSSTEVGNSDVNAEMEVEMDIEGLELAGGTLDEAIDRGEAIEARPIIENNVVKEEKARDTHAASQQESVDTLVEEVLSNIHSMRTSRGLFCNDQKIGLSISDAMGYMVPESDVFNEAVDKVVGLVSKLVSKDEGIDAQQSKTNIQELIQASLERHLPAYAKRINAKLQLAHKIGSSVTRTELPVGSLVSDGVFSISNVADASSIQLVQHNYASINLFCGSDLSHYLGPVRTAICSCSGIWGQVLGSGSGSVPADAGLHGEAAGAGAGSSSSHEWCYVTDVCKGVKSGADCIVQVDPFRTACISYHTAPGTSASAAATATHGGPGASFASISYARVTPMLNLNIDFGAVWGAFGKWIDQTQVVSQWVRFESAFSVAGSFANKLTKCIPSYLWRTVVGLWLLQVAEELTSNTLFQYVLAAVFGVVLAVIWVVLVVYRTIEGMVKNSTPMFVPGLGLAVLGPLWYAMRLDYVRNMLISGLLGFWEQGWGPYHNAGKIYFGVSMLLSIFLKHYFRLFTPKSNSSYVLKTLIKGIGCLLLCYCTSNKEVSAAFLLYGLMQDHILYWYFRARLSYEASHQKTSAAIMGRPLYTTKELENLTKTTTERELAKLQEYLNKNPEKTDNLQDKLRQGDKGEAASLLGRFARGAFHLASTPLVPGTPQYIAEGLDVEDDEDEFVDAAGDDRMPAPPSAGARISSKKGAGTGLILIIIFIVVGVTAVFVQQWLANNQNSSSAQLFNNTLGNIDYAAIGKTAAVSAQRAKDLASKLISLGMEQAVKLTK